MRIINADELEKKMYHEAFEVDSELQMWNSGCWIRYKLFEKCLENTPTIDAADRPQGEWKFSSAFTDSWGNELEKVKCSHCGYETLAISRIVKDGNFCLNCGTRMK